MTEFEVQHLIVGSRYEFDGATLAYMAWAIAFMFLGRIGGEGWSVTTLGLLTALYLVGGVFLAIRCAASMVRFARQNALLAEFRPKFAVFIPLLNRPTLVLRILLFLITPAVVLHLLWLRPMH